MTAAAPTDTVRTSWLTRSKALGVALLVAGMLSSAILVTAPGTFDVTDPRRGFLVWMDDVVVLGPVDGYRYNPYDYPPGTKTLLGLAGKAGDAVGISRPNSLKILLLTFQAHHGVGRVRVDRQHAARPVRSGCARRSALSARAIWTFCMRRFWWPRSSVFNETGRSGVGPVARCAVRSNRSPWFCCPSMRCT